MIAETCILLLTTAFNAVNTEPAQLVIQPIEAGISGRAWPGKVQLDPGLCDMAPSTRDAIIAHEVGHLIAFRELPCASIFGPRAEQLADHYAARRRPDLLAHLDERCSAGYAWYCEKALNWRQ